MISYRNPYTRLDSKLESLPILPLLLCAKVTVDKQINKVDYLEIMKVVIKLKLDKHTGSLIGYWLTRKIHEKELAYLCLLRFQKIDMENIFQWLAPIMRLDQDEQVLMNKIAMLKAIFYRLGIDKSDFPQWYEALPYITDKEVKNRISFLIKHLLDDGNVEKEEKISSYSFSDNILPPVEESFYQYLILTNKQRVLLRLTLGSSSIEREQKNKIIIELLTMEEEKMDSLIEVFEDEIKGRERMDSKALTSENFNVALDHIILLGLN